MTTEIWRVHILWIFQITKITRAKSLIQNCLSGGFQERVRIIHKSQETLNLRRFLARFLLRDNRMTIILEKFEIHSKKINSQ